MVAVVVLGDVEDDDDEADVLAVVLTDLSPDFSELRVVLSDFLGQLGSFA
jgi:hypothetical protein